MARTVALILASLAAHAASAAELTSFCADCQMQTGVGGTYHYWGGTGSAVIPLTVVWGEGGRWEIGAFRMTSSQDFFDSTFGTEIHVADAYWGFSASRRWELFSQPHWRIVVGLGGSYKTAEDRASASHWNFAEQLGLRICPAVGATIELSLRHWSNAGLRLPNHGQDFATLTFAILPGTFGR